MKAMVLKKAMAVEENPLEYIEVPTPEPGPGELLIRVHACGICRTDLHTVEGEIQPTRMPIIPGHQVIGAVVSRGREAKRFREGDRVGMAWLFRTCGECPFCLTGKENLCEKAQFTPTGALPSTRRSTRISPTPYRPSSPTRRRHRFCAPGSLDIVPCGFQR
jgi:propanol-preferring alcohol dehydrogenase